MSTGHLAIDICLWTVAVISFIEHCVWASRKRAPKRNRLVAPSIHCERNPDWDKINKIPFFHRQAN